MDVIRAASGAGGVASASLVSPPPAMLENLPVAIYACDAMGRILWFNGKAVELWGRTPALRDDSELFCGSYRLQFGGRWITRAETPMAHVLQTGDAVHGVEALVERPDGSRIWATVHIDPIRDHTGSVVGAVNCFHDTTDLHETTAALKREQQALLRAKADLAASERRYRDILEALPAAVYTTDAAGRVTYYNRAAVDLTGREPELGTDRWCVTLRLLLPDGQVLPHEYCPMAVALKEDRAIRNVEAVAERPDGSRVPILPYPTPLHDDNGTLIGAVNMLVDVTEQKKAEERQHLLLKELNHRVKNNMQMLHSLLVTAQRECANDEARQMLADATRRVAAMAGAQQVLYATAAGMTFSGREFIAAVCDRARLAFGDDVAIEAEASGEFANDTALPLALIVNELVTNAVKHGRGGQSSSVRVGLSPQLLYVEDDGPGFDLTSVRKRGSGLGLVQGLAAQLGARLQVARAAGARCELRFAEP